MKGTMAIDLPTLYAQILTCQTLAAGRDVLFTALAGAVPELAALTPHPDDPSRQIAWGALLGEALTRNTSHIPVDVRDEVGSLKAVLMDRLDRIADPDKRMEHAQDLVLLGQGATVQATNAKAEKAKGGKL